MRIAETSDLWWKNAVIYCLDVETFYDDDGDGTGDFAGLSQRVDYLAALGATCIWLMPFYPTPDRDDGYDVTDFFGVDSRLGTLGDLVEFIRSAKDRGMRVIADFVVNHTSDRHPWFVEPGSPRTTRTATTTCGGRTLPRTRPPKSCFPESRRRCGPRTRPPASGTCTCSTSTSRTPHTCSSSDATLVLLHNFSADTVKVTGNTGPDDAPGNTYKGAVLLDLLDGGNVPLEPDGGFTVELGRYGYRWFRVHRQGDRLVP